MPSAAATHRFGPFRYDARTGELSRDEGTIRLSPRLAAVLEVLLDHPGELVERETLRERIWPHTFVDFEHGLTAAINELRAALADSAHRPTYIETMPRRGYRWLAPVERIERVPGGKVFHTPSMARRRAVLAIASVVAVVALMLAAVLPQVSSRRTAGAGAVEARRLAARGEIELSGRSADEVRSSITDLRRTIALDPGYAPAYAALASAYTTAVRFGHLSPREAHPAASEAARAAVGLRSDLAAAHVALGDVLFFLEWDPDAAEAEMQRARELAPEDPVVLGAYARFLQKTCRFEEAIAVCRRLLDRDPRQGTLRLATAYLEARRFDEAIAVLSPEVEGTPAVSSASLALAAAQAARGDCVEALALADRGRPLLEVEPEDGVAAVMRGWVLARCGRETDARAVVRAYQESGARGWADPITIAAVFAALGDTEEAIRLVERGVEERSPTAMSLELDFMLDPVRHDPRFAAAVDRVRDGHPPRRCGVPPPDPRRP